MTSAYRYSIIVPVYNTESFIRRCIDSILAQTFNDFELILVDDGSTDNSGRICDEYAVKDKRIKVIHQNNQGVSSARKTGLNTATGEYITFVDSDDILMRDCIETFVKTSVENPDSEIIIGNIQNFKSEHIDISTYRKKCINRGIYPAPWGKLFKRKIFDNNIFNIPRDITVGEDMLMNIRLAFNTKNNVCIIPKQIYKYQANDNGTMSNFMSTPEYEYQFNSYLIESIPENERSKYLSVCNSYGIQVMLNVFDNRINISDKKNWINSLFYKRLINNIKNYGNPVSSLGYAKIKYHSPFIRLIILLPHLLRRYLYHLKTVLSHHLISYY